MADERLVRLFSILGNYDEELEIPEVTKNSNFAEKKTF